MERLSKTELAATDAWKAHAQVLQEILDHHINEEERGIFDEESGVTLAIPLRNSGVRAAPDAARTG